MIPTATDIADNLLPQILVDHPVAGLVIVLVALYMPPLVLASKVCKTKEDYAYVVRKLALSLLSAISIIGFPLAIVHFYHVYQALLFDSEG